MPFSTYLDRKRADCRELVAELGEHFDYVSILGTDVSSTIYTVHRKSTSVSEGESSRGFVVKLHSGGAFYEYSLNDISGDKRAITARILDSLTLADRLKPVTIRCEAVRDEPMRRDFVRGSDFSDYSDQYLTDFCTRLRDELLAQDDKVVNAAVNLMPRTVSSLFITKNRELSQHYGWVNSAMQVYYQDGRLVPAFDVGCASHLLSRLLEELPRRTGPLVELARHLVKATPIEPGVYDVITDSSISGLIAHEAFGHGVEMDQFVKDRALAKSYMGKYVASPITNMRDGAAATLSAASYFFDDDGVLAHDTQIIRDGVLVAGLSDLTSACQLGTEPTGNGRRESYKRKAYSRMTNTFFDAGHDKLEDMIASVRHGYMLFQTNNGMEDPKNWQIQCTAEYGIEIVDGKLTDHYVSPVVMSGSVPELLRSISMVSDETSVIGAGQCGKGYKEWVRVADGGPALKVRVKLA